MKNKFKIENLKLKISNGFTLVELLIYMALLSIFLITLSGIFVNIMEVQLESDATSAVEQDGRFILSRLAYDINSAQVVTTPAGLGTTASNLDFTVPGISYSYSLNANNLQLSENGQPSNLNSSETQVSNLTFQRIGNPLGKHTFKIQFTITSKTQRPSGPETKTFTTTIGLR